MKSQDKTIDVRGQTCPHPVLKTRTGLVELEPGQVLEVLVDYERSVKKTIPDICKKYDCPYEVKEEKENDKTFWIFFIEKSDNPTINLGSKNKR
jgi:TusA-related sulfurtransferase